MSMGIWIQSNDQEAKLYHKTKIKEVNEIDIIDTILQALLFIDNKKAKLRILQYCIGYIEDDS